MVRAIHRIRKQINGDTHVQLQNSHKTEEPLVATVIQELVGQFGSGITAFFAYRSGTVGRDAQFMVNDAEQLEHA